MKPGIKFKDIVVGSGTQANEDDIVFVEVSYFLNKGEQLSFFDSPNKIFRIDLRKRDVIAGLRYGIIGMFEGGIRKVRISPHLAFGKDGIPNKVPPNAVLLCEIKLVEIWKDGVSLLKYETPIKQILVSHSGEAARNLARWQFGLKEDGDFGVSLNYPIPGMTWRHTRNRNYRDSLDKETTEKLFDEIENLPQKYPDVCLKTEELWADMSEPAGNITRERKTDRLCLRFSVFKGGQNIVDFALPESSPILNSLRLMQIITELIEKNECESSQS